MCRVLLVEDSKIQHYVVGAALKELGSDVELTIAETLEEAKQWLVTGCQFDVIILDLGLPDSSGVESFISLRGVCSDIPIVVCTADDTAETALDCIRRGAETVIIKPALRSLSRIVAYAVERKRVRTMLEDMVRRKMEAVACDYQKDLNVARATLLETSTALGMTQGKEPTRWVEADSKLQTNCG